MSVSSSLAPRAFRLVFVVGLALGSSSVGCNERFQFDLPVAGSGGSAGASFDGAGASSGGGGSPDLGGGASAAGGGGGGALAGSGAASSSCGAFGVCPADLHCGDDDLCWQCANDADCAAYALPRCEPTRHRCVPCVATADCELGFACDSLANRCLKNCREDLDCKGQHGCDERRLVCYQCDEDRECLASPLGTMCASDGSGCVQCRKDTDCPDQHCDQLVGRCVDCRDGLDCASGLCSPTSFTCLPN